MKSLRPILPHPTDPGLALVELTKGYFATISAVDGPEIGRFNWCASIATNGMVYAIRWHGHDGEKYLHRFIGRMMGLEMTAEIDHENRNGLDCRRSNLRDATRAQNQQNKGIQKNNRSGVSGVTWTPRLGKWMVHVRGGVGGRYVGVFARLEDATAAAAAARELPRSFVS